MKILNLGCGTRTSSHAGVVNIDWSISLRLRRSLAGRALAPMFLRGDRLARIRSLPTNILVHNLQKGIPFESDSIDVVYHSHVLEHIDRGAVESFFAEIRRVLKRGGVHRIVVPDLELLCRQYLESVARAKLDSGTRENHDGYVAAILEQCVRKEAYGSSQQRLLRRRLENFMLGDARKRGETHQWMYDRINLTQLLAQSGFRDVTIESFDKSRIPEWEDMSLDVNETGDQYKPGSLYIEAIK